MDQKKYYTLEEAAQMLGLTLAEVNQRRERNELRGFRDGPSFKFKVEDVEALARQMRAAKKPAASGEESSDVLLSEAALGGSESTASGTVIGPPGKTQSDSDIRLADSALGLDQASKPAAGADKELVLDEASLVDEGQISLDDEASGTVASVAPDVAPVAGSSSALELAVGPKKLDDDDIVLGGSSPSGSDISIGSDSGISLLDPTDSGLSLEEPLETGKAEEESLELGEDDMLTFADDSVATEAPTALKKDEEFLLTPLEEAAEEESESGSQVIALDSPAAGDMTATMVAPAPGPHAAPGMAAMLDEDFAAAGAPALAAAVAPAGIAAPLGPAHPVFAEGMPLAGAGAVPAAIPETPYTGLNVAALSACLVLILVCGWLAFDLVRNMWSWNGSFPVNSGIMDSILGLFG